MSEKADEKGVNTSSEDEVIDNRMDDADAGIGSPADEMETHNLDIDDYDEILEAIEKDEDESSGDSEKTDDSTSTDEGSSEDEDSEGDDGDDPPRIPKSRFDEVNTQKNEYKDQLETERIERARLEGRLNALETQLAVHGKEATEETVTNPFEELLGGEPQEILDALQEDPAKFFKQMRDASDEQARKKLAIETSEKAAQDALFAGLDKFAEEHDGFTDELHRLERVMTQDPIHNLVSAYAYEVEIPALKTQLEEATKDVDARIEAARAEGIKQGKVEAVKAIRAKSAAGVLDGSASTQGGKPSVDPDLDDTEKGGGLRQILTDKLLRRREAAGK
jgi:hypothetical protein